MHAMDNQIAPEPRNRQQASIGRLLGEYTLVFALFYAVVFSPFWVYGRSFFRSIDALTQYLPELTFSRYWAKTILTGLKAGALEIPLWSPWIGLGQGVLGNVISFKPLNFLYCLFRYDQVELYMFVRLVIGTYLSGLAFLIYGRTRTRNRPYLILGALIYVFSGFIPFFVTRHWLFMEMTFFFPLMLLGVDQVFEGKWSWLFVITVFLTAMSYYYTLFLITIPAVVYAVFHYFELNGEDRRKYGGFWRIVLRHVVQYSVGLCLAMVYIIPSLVNTLESCRVSSVKGVNLLVWEPKVYLAFVSAIVDPINMGYGGAYIALPSIALLGLISVFYYRRKRDRVLRGQIAFYILAYLIPILTMLFNAFMGKTMRWSFVFTFWVALATACIIPVLQKKSTKGFLFCTLVFCVYAIVYLGVSVWTGNAVTLSIVLELVGLAAFYFACLSDWGRRNRGARTAILFLVLLAELTTKSYERLSPQYENNIPAFFSEGTVLSRAENNAVDALEMVDDDSVYRVDSVMEDATDRSYLANYGARDQVNGVSSYYNLNSDGLTSWSLGVGNSHQGSIFEISDMAQRTALDTLLGVKYAVALEDARERVPYGYDLLKSRKKLLSDGTETKAYLYRNKYALPLAYAYDRCIDYETYEQLPPNRKEQAMLQGVVLEQENAMEKADLKYDDIVLLDRDAIYAALEEIAKDDEDLAVEDGRLRVKKAKYTATIPVESAVGEVYLQLTGAAFKSENYYWEEAEAKRQAGEPRLQVIASRRKARQWQPDETTVLSVSCGNANDEVDLHDPCDQYYYGKRDVALNLGYGEIKKNIKIRFSKPGEYSFDDIALICQPMDGYAQKVAALQKNGATSTEIEGNRVTLNFDLDRDAMACLSIPYSSGWRVSVDGEPAKLVKANIAFMGVMVPKGAHTVEFSYMPKGLRLGAIISLGTLIALISVGLFRKLRRRRDADASKG